MVVAKQEGCHRDDAEASEAPDGGTMSVGPPARKREHIQECLGIAVWPRQQHQRQRDGGHADEGRSSQPRRQPVGQRSSQCQKQRRDDDLAEERVPGQGQARDRHVVLQDHPRVEEVSAGQLAGENLLSARQMDEVIVGKGEGEVVVEERRGEDRQQGADMTPGARWSRPRHCNFHR